ncbi:MAG: T9SS type A sorting domain-containing protein, partial [Bacteroidales bacterium]|nr:T9SS type A sorting domain-containing protein [Bacteroidales bacterium]
ATIRVINVMGQVMKTIYTTEEKSRISTKDLSAGIYFLSVEQNGRRFTTKFSKQ